MSETKSNNDEALDAPKGLSEFTDDEIMRAIKTRWLDKVIWKQVVLEMMQQYWLIDKKASASDWLKDLLTEDPKQKLLQGIQWVLNDYSGYCFTDDKYYLYIKWNNIFYRELDDQTFIDKDYVTFTIKNWKIKIKKKIKLSFSENIIF